MSVELSKEEQKATADKYPTPAAGLRRVINDGDMPNTPVEWIEVRFQASGEVTYRWRQPRALEDDGGYLPGS